MHSTAETVRAEAAAPGHDEGPRRPWDCCVWPLAVFLAAGVLEPTAAGGGLAATLGIPFSAYPLVYSLKLGATLLAVARVWRPIRDWLGRPSWWPPLVGAALVVPWIVLAALEREAGLWPGAPARAAFDPFAAFGAGSATAGGFLLVRGIGLVLVVPLVEELFLRGFLMRYVIDEDFWRVPFGTLTPTAAAACAAYAALSHPAEAVAAVVWFATISGIAVATRRPIDCVLAHAGTNLALGVYVIATGAWWLV